MRWRGWATYRLGGRNLFFLVPCAVVGSWWYLRMREARATWILLALVIGSFALGQAYSVADERSLDAGVAALLWLSALTWFAATSLALRGTGRIRWGGMGDETTENEGTAHLEMIVNSVIKRSAKYRAALLLMFTNMFLALFAAVLMAIHRGTEAQVKSPEPVPVSPSIKRHCNRHRLARQQSMNFSAGQECPKEPDTQLIQQLEVLMVRAKTERPTAIMLRASVDGQPFRRTSDSPIMTNAGLAMARLECIRAALRTARIETPVIGKIRDAIDRHESDSDRVVEVYFLP